MDLAAAAAKGLGVVLAIYVALAAGRAIKEGDLWKAAGTVLIAGLVSAFIFSSDFRDTLANTTKSVFENTFKTDSNQQPTNQPQQNKK